MPRCTRKGCGKEYSEDNNESCTFHSGAPVFHEGLKSWSCCADTNKPVLDFDEFMNIKGCVETDRHTSDKPEIEPAAPSSTPSDITAQKNAASEVIGSSIPSNPTPAPSSTIKPKASVPPPPIVEEDDDLSVRVAPGTTCRRKGCGVAFVSDEVHRSGDGEETKCVYHPAPPIFREGSKGYLCCKRRVLEFEEFLKIEGCKTGRHLFSPKVNPEKTEEFTTCRVDHYQTLDQVHVSVFAKKVDKDRSSVTFEEDKLSVNLYLPDSKRFSKTIELFGPIAPDQSTFQVFGTKVEVHLKKKDTRSWTILEKPTHDLGIALTFGVSGRTGSTGAKDFVLDAQNSVRA